MIDRDALSRRIRSRCGRPVTMLTVLVVSLLLLSGPSHAVTINVPTTFAAADASDGIVDGTFTVAGDLTIATGGKITCNDPATPPSASACRIKIVVSGDMEMQPGSAILAQNRFESGSGGIIKIVVGGDLTLRGTNGATPGAKISSGDKTAGGTVGTAGPITIKVGNPAAAPPIGDLVVEPGAKILANSANQSGGTIVIKVARSALIDGAIASIGNTSGTGGMQAPGGGPITIDAGCDLTIGDDGTVRSVGVDPGANLVHLEGGCVVKIFGLVESTGPGHVLPISPANQCNRLGKPQNSTACVLVLAGQQLVVDAANHNGQVNADTGAPGGSIGNSWIDLISGGSVHILGSTDVPFAVHANGLAGTNDRGGMITVIAQSGHAVLSNLAVQADATGGGGRGGSVGVEAGGSLILDTARLFARGDFVVTGGFGVGGTIQLHSFAGNMSWQNGVGDVQPTGTGVAAANRGAITFHNCAGGVVNTTGTTFTHFGTPTTPTSVAAGPCGGTPTLPAGLVLPACVCVVPTLDTCIAVTKFCTDATTPGGEIHFFGTVRNCGTETLTNVTVTDDNGTPSPSDDVQVLQLATPLASGQSANYTGSYTPASSPSTDTVTAIGTGASSNTPVDANASATCSVPPPPGTGDEGCTPGYWKQEHHLDSWVATGFSENQSAGSVFSALKTMCPTQAGQTLLASLDGGGGDTFCQKVEILLRAAVAAVLNAAHPGIDYPRTVAGIVNAVNAAIASGNKDTVIGLATALDRDNNGPGRCPLD